MFGRYEAQIKEVGAAAEAINVFRFLALALATVVGVSNALAGAAGNADLGASWLGGKDIVTALAGKTLEGRYANGRHFTETYIDDGRVQYSEDGQTIGGRWSVTAGTLCTIYDSDPTGGCFRVNRVNANCFEFYFVARTEEAAPGPDGAKPSWTARGSVNGEPSACQDGANV